jgi:hypothetical protein
MTSSSSHHYALGMEPPRDIHPGTVTECEACSEFVRFDDLDSTMVRTGDATVEPDTDIAEDVAWWKAEVDGMRKRIDELGAENLALRQKLHNTEREAEDTAPGWGRVYRFGPGQIETTTEADAPATRDAVKRLSKDLWSLRMQVGEIVKHLELDHPRVDLGDSFSDEQLVSFRLRFPNRHLMSVTRRTFGAHGDLAGDLDEVIPALSKIADESAAERISVLAQWFTEARTIAAFERLAARHV